MGIEGNILDLYNSEQLDTNAILGYFASSQSPLSTYMIYHVP